MINAITKHRGSLSWTDILETNMKDLLVHSCQLFSYFHYGENKFTIMILFQASQAGVQLCVFTVIGLSLFALYTYNQPKTIQLKMYVNVYIWMFLGFYSISFGVWYRVFSIRVVMVDHDGPGDYHSLYLKGFTQ